MRRFSPLLLPLLLILYIYGAFAFGIPGALALWPSFEFKDGELAKIRTSGSFLRGSLSIISYESLLFGGEFVHESKFLGFNDIFVTTEKQEDGALVIKRVEINNRSYEKTLCDHPEIMAEAEKVLQLGRDKFAKVKKKIEEQKLKRNQSGRLG